MSNAKLGSDVRRFVSGQEIFHLNQQERKNVKYCHASSFFANRQRR